MNALKWSEGFLGDNLSIEGNCKYEEPGWSIVMDADYPKLLISEQGGRFYNGLRIKHSQRAVLSLRIFLRQLSSVQKQIGACVQLPVLKTTYPTYPNNNACYLGGHSSNLVTIGFMRITY